MNLLLVVLGGGIGAGDRYLLDSWLHPQLGNGFPWGTFAVNALGSLMIGLVFGLARTKAIPPGTTLFLTVGVLGGFTTFSTFSLQTLRLIANGDLAVSSLNAAGRLSVGLLAV
jgi:fluoride exporter